MIVSDLTQIKLESKSICVDIESYDPHLKGAGPGFVHNRAYVVGIGIGDLKNQYYIPIRHDNYDNIPIELVSNWFKDNLTQDYNVFGANILYDLEGLSCCKIYTRGSKFYDVQYAEALLDSNTRKFSLDYLAEKYLGRKKGILELRDNYLKVFNKVPTTDEVYKSLASLDVNVVGEYCCIDVLLTLEVAKRQIKLLKDNNLFELFKFECSLIPILNRIRLQGVKVDIHKTIKYYDSYSKELSELRSKYNFNINSSNQLGDYFSSIGIDVPSSVDNPYIHYSITRDWLEINKNNNEQISSILRYRMLNKLVNTFLKSYLIGNLWGPEGLNNGERLRTQYHPLRNDKYGTVSGRFSSSNPNLQNIPSRDSELKHVRSLFVPNNKDEVWVSIDRSQIEYRLVVNFSVGESGRKAKQMYIENSDTDFHELVMHYTGLERKPAKICNFLLVYGGQIKKLSEMFGGNQELASKIFNQYHNRLPFIKRTFEHFQSIGRRNKEIRTILNRRSILRDPKECYRSLNRFIQGSAADIMKIDIIELYKAGVYDTIGYPLLTVHDELDFSIPKDKIKYLSDVRDVMENAYKKYTDKIQVPLTVTMSCGNNWDELTEMR